MTLSPKLPVLLCSLALSACSTSSSNPPNSASAQKQTAASAGAASFSGDRTQLQVLVPQCLRVLQGQPVSVSDLKRFGYSRTALNPNAYQRVTSRNVVGLTGSFDQFAYKPNTNCSLSIGMSQRARFRAFEQNAFSVLERNGFKRSETKATFGGKRVSYQSADGRFVANTRLSRTGTVTGSLNIKRK